MAAGAGYSTTWRAKRSEKTGRNRQVVDWLLHGGPANQASQLHQWLEALPGRGVPISARIPRPMVEAVQCGTHPHHVAGGGGGGGVGLTVTPRLMANGGALFNSIMSLPSFQGRARHHFPPLRSAVSTARDRMEADDFSLQL